MTEPSTPWSKGKIAACTGILIAGVLAGLAYPPLWLAYVAGGAGWLAYQDGKKKRNR